MRLAIWNTNYFRKYGGAEKAVNYLLNRFNDLGIETTLIANRFKVYQRNNEFFKPLHSNVKIYQNTFYNPWDSSENPFIFILKFLKYIKAALQLTFFFKRNRFQIIHLHYVSWDILLLALYKYIFRYHLVVTFRAGEDEVARQVNLSKFKIKIAIKFADRVTAVSKDICEKLKNNYSFLNTIYIPNGVDINEIQSLATKSLSKIKEGNFVYCGRLSHQKRVPFLIRAFNECINRGCKQDLYIVGDGEEMDKINNLIKLYCIEERIIILGALTHGQALRVIKESICLVLSSLFEGFPQVVLEAMALGKPVIVPEIGGLKEIVTHNDNGYLFPVDREDVLCDLIMIISEDKAKATEMGSNF